MKKNVVRGLALALVILMCLSLLPLAARADEGDIPAVAGTYEPVRIEPTCGENGYIQMYNAATGAWGEVVDFIPATGAHSFMPVVNEDYLIEQGESFCLDGDLYWMSCANRTADGRVCGASAEDAYNAAVDHLVAELTERKNKGEQKSDAEWQLIAENAIKEFDARYKFTYGGQGHAWIEFDGQEATCTSDGWTAYAECENCGEIVDYSVIPAKGHRWGEYAVVTEATETEPGLEARVCEVCGMEETREIPVLTPAEPEPTAAPTATPEVKAETKTEDKTEDKTETKAEATPAPTVAPEPTTTPEPTTEPEDEEPDWEEIMKLRENVQLAQGAVDPGVVDAFMEAMPTLGLDAETTAILDVKDVTPVRKDDFTPLSDEEVAKLGGLDFVMPLPEDYDPEGGPLEVYHFNEKTQEWELMEVEVDLENGVVVVKNAGSFSPFAMIRKAGAADPFARNGKRLDDYIITQGVPKKAAGKVSLLGETPEYTVTLNANGGTISDGTDNTLTGAAGSTATLLDGSKITRTGYTFKGWNNEINGDGNFYAPGADYTFYQNETLYAQWTKDLTVRYYSHGGTGTMTNEPAKPGDTVAIKPNGFTKTDRTFKDWNTKADGSGTTYEVGANYTFPTTATEDLSLYAQWTVAVSFDANGGSGWMESKQALENTEYPIPDNEFSRTGYTFNGWATTADGEIKYTDKIPAEDMTGPITLYAQWAEGYTITFNKNGADGDETMDPQSVKKSDLSEGVPLNANKYTNTDKTFAGWDTNYNAETPTFKDKDTLTEENLTADMTLYAIWKAPVTITFNKNASTATGSIPDQIVPSGVATKLQKKPDTVRLTGSTFEGWNTKQDKTGTHYDDEAEITITSDTPLYAEWKRTEITGNYYIKGESSDVDKEAFVGETLTAVIPSGSNYKESELNFQWYHDGAEIPNATKKTYVPVSAYIGQEITFKVFDKTNKEISKESSNSKLIEEWYIVGFTVVTDTGTTGGSAWARMYNDSTQLASKEVKDADGNTIIKAYDSTHWWVKKGASTNIILTVTPPSGNYAHVYCNNRLIGSFGNSSSTTSTTRTTYSSTYSARTGSYSPATTSSYSSSTSSASRTFSVSPVDENKIYTIYFNYSSSSPRTADESQLGLWSALCVVSLAAGVTLLTVQRKRKHKA